MKKRLHNIQLFITITCLSMLGASFISVHAEEDVEDSDKITMHTLDKYKDKIDASGYEDWNIDFNPKLREFYGGYNRDGSFYIFRPKDNATFMATNLKVTWRKGGGVDKHFYVPSLGYAITENDDYEIREVSSVSGLFQLKEARSTWKHPIYHEDSLTSEVLPAGTYQVTRQALEFVELVKPDGNKVWVCPQYDNNDNFFKTSYGQFVDSKSILSVPSVNGKPIHQLIMPVREDKRIGIAMQPKYVTIHNTGNDGYGATAKAHANAQVNDKRTFVSWHYTVDNNEIYQSIPMNEMAWHAGDGQNIGNGATIGIEICENKDGNYAQAERNAAYLTAQILFENGMPSDAVRMHKDWSGKDCAKNILHGTKGTMGWAGFKNLVKQEYEKLVMLNDVDLAIPAGFENFITTAAVKFDSGFTQGYELGSNVQKTIDTLKSVDATAQVEVYKNGSLVAPTNKIATGQQVRITKGDQVFRYMIVVKGDVNGDGEIYATDYVGIKNQIMGKNALGLAYLKAADVNQDGHVYATDYVKVKNHIMGVSKLN